MHQFIERQITKIPTKTNRSAKQAYINLINKINLPKRKHHTQMGSLVKTTRHLRKKLYNFSITSSGNGNKGKNTLMQSVKSTVP